MPVSGALVGAFVGSGVGFGVGLGVGFGVGAGVERGVGAAVWVARGVGSGVRCGAEVGPPVEVGWLGAGVPIGAPVGPAGTAGELLATDSEGLGIALDAALADGLPAGSVGLVLTPGVPLGVGTAWLPVTGAGVATCAICDGCPARSVRCCSSTPPIPSATVARTRFRMPRLRMRRAR